MIRIKFRRAFNEARKSEGFTTESDVMRETRRGHSQQYLADFASVPKRGIDDHTSEASH
jgi:hypothetical protein